MKNRTPRTPRTRITTGQAADWDMLGLAADQVKIEIKLTHKGQTYRTNVRGFEPTEEEAAYAKGRACNAIDDLLAAMAKGGK